MSAAWVVGVVFLLNKHETLYAVYRTGSLSALSFRADKPPSPITHHFILRSCCTRVAGTTSTHNRSVFNAARSPLALPWACLSQLPLPCMRSRVCPALYSSRSPWARRLSIGPRWCCRHRRMATRSRSTRLLCLAVRWCRALSR